MMGDMDPRLVDQTHVQVRTAHVLPHDEGPGIADGFLLVLFSGLEHPVHGADCALARRRVLRVCPDEADAHHPVVAAPSSDLWSGRSAQASRISSLKPRSKGMVALQPKRA